MSRLLLAADLHLGHKNITKFRTEFSSAEEHHETVLENIKLSVNKADSLWLLGDIAFTRDWLVRLQEIKCRRKVLILGNHDLERGVKFPDFIGIYDEVHALVSHRNYWFSHAPIHESEIRGKLANIHGHCIDLKTEILTLEGWKSYEQICKGESLYSYNPSTQQLEIDSVKDIISNNYSGLVYKYDSFKGFNIRVTDRHRMAFKNCSDKYSVETADKFFSRYKAKIIKAGNIKNRGVLLSDEMLKLYIALAADGNITKSNLCRFILYKERKINNCIELLENLNIPYKILDYTDNARKCIHFRLPDELIGWNIKGLDSKLIHCTQEQAYIIKETYQWTDGNRDLIFTSKKEEADLLQHIFTINGFICKTHERNHGFSNNRSYQLSVTKGEERLVTKIHNKVTTEMVEDELFWCISTNNQNFLARREGSVMLIGNCHSAVIDSPYYQCVSLEHTDYKAIPFEQVVSRFKEYKEK